MQNKGRGMMRLRVNASQMDEKLLALEALFTYARALGARFHPAARALIGACVPTLVYRWNEKARGAAATALSEAYKCVVLAAAEGADGVTMADARDLLGSVLKPLTDAVGKEDSPEAADALFEALREVLALERTHSVGALTGGPALQGIVQLIKRQLQSDESRCKARAAAAAERDDDEEADEEEESEIEAEGELLGTCAALVVELLRQHGSAAVGIVEAQLLPHVQPWLLGGDTTRLALGLETLGAIIEHAGREHAKKYVAAALPLLSEHAASEESRLRRAALYGLGVVCEHGGKLLSRSAAAELAQRLLAILTDPAARFSANVEASEAAAAALGKMLVHRPNAIVDPATMLPAWVAWLPLRYNEDDATVAITSLCKLLEADAQSVLGTVRGNLRT